MNKFSLLIFIIFLSCSKDQEPSEPSTPQYNLTVNVNPQDGGLVNPKTGTYNASQTVTIVASPNQNFFFKNWSGDWNGETETLTLTMDSNKVLVANFEKLFYLDSNGVTLKANPDTPVGTQIQHNGSIFTVVSENQLRDMIDNNEDISNVITSKITDMRLMFYSNNLNGDISSWDVSNVTDMSWMFSGSTFDQPIGNWDVSNVTDMSYMFSGSDFNQSLNNWDVSSVTTMFGMFSESEFNQPLNNWDVSNVTGMRYMFRWSNFNQDISNWDVSSVSDCWDFNAYYRTTGNIGGYLAESNFPNFTICNPN